MHSGSITEQTRLQVERAQRAAEEARQRIRCGKGGGLKLGEDSETPSAAVIDEDKLADYGAD